MILENIKKKIKKDSPETDEPQESSGHINEQGPETLSAASEPHPNFDEPRNCRVVSVYSPKGGSGKTVIALNLAVALCLQGKKVLLLDFDLRSPMEIAQAVNIKVRGSLYDIMRNFSQIEDRFDLVLEELLFHYREDLDYIPAIKKIEYGPKIKSEQITPVINKLRDKYDFIIIDAGSDLTGILVKLFDNSNLILTVIAPDILSVYKAEWCLDVFQNIRFPLRMIRVVLNRAESKGSYSMQEIRLALSAEIIASIPSDGKTLNYALNRQIPVVLDSPESPFAKAIKEAAQIFIEDEDLFVTVNFDAHQHLSDIFGDGYDFWNDQGLYVEEDDEDLKARGGMLELKKRVHKRLLEEINLSNMTTDVLTKKGPEYEKMRQQIEKSVMNILSQETGQHIASQEARNRIIRELIDDVMGFGPLEDLIKDSTVTEIMVNNTDKVYIEKRGKLFLTEKKFLSQGHIKTVIERIIAPLGRRIDESTPMVDARLPDGSRVNAIIPPLALSGPTLTIRKFSKKKLTIRELISEYSSLTHDMADFLEGCVKLRKNMIVSGGTDSGKTTFLNILSECIPDGERVITIEDAAEIKLHHEHWIRLESRPPNIEGRGAITISDLFKNTLRMRPDRIIVGECRGKEVIDMLQAMNTGHDGSMSTVHANTPQDVITRLDSLMLMSGIEIPIRAIREMIASAIDVIVQTAKFSDGTRKVTHISEVIDVDKDGTVILKDIFIFDEHGLDKDSSVRGEYISTGYVPTFFEQFARRGIDIKEAVFRKKAG